MLYCQKGDAANRECNAYLQRDDLLHATEKADESQLECFHSCEATPEKCGLIHGLNYNYYGICSLVCTFSISVVLE